MAKDLSSSSSSTRIPRLDGITRIPLPSSIRHQQQQQQQTVIMPPPPSPVPQKLLTTTTTTTKIGRPNSFNGLKVSPGISTMASTLKKSLSGERFSEAANIMSRKTATVMKKFLTKPEKSEKNIEMKSSQDNKLDNNNITVILEKGSKESSNEKISSYDNITNTIIKDPLNSVLRRSDTFIRDCNDDMITTQFDITQNMIQSTPVNKNSTTTKIYDKSKEYCWGITQDIHQQSNSILSSPPTTKIINNCNSSSSKIHQKHLIGITTNQTILQQQQQSIITSPMNCTKSKIQQQKLIPNKEQDHQSNKIINNLTKTIDNSNYYQQNYNRSSSINCEQQQQQQSFFNNTQIDENKSIRKSQCFGEISNLTINNDENNVTVNLLESKSFEHLSDITFPLDFDDTIRATQKIDQSNEFIKNENDLNNTIILKNKKDMTLILNSTCNDDGKNILDITTTKSSSSSSPLCNIMNTTHDIIDSPIILNKNNTNLLYMSPVSQENFNNQLSQKKHQQQQQQCSDSRNSLTRTPDDYNIESMDIDDCDGNIYDIPSSVQQVLSLKALQELKQTNKPRFSFGLDLTECTLDCSIELCDVSLTSNGASIGCGGGGANNTTGGNGNNINLGLTSPNSLKKQNSFEFDESLGILTPDQMKEFLDSNTTNTTNNLDLPFVLHNSSGFCGGNGNNNKLSIINHQMRIDQTPSPEDLPLDPVGVKTDTDDIVMELPPLNNLQLQQQQQQQQQDFNQASQPSQLSHSTTLTYTELSQTDTDSKTDQMTKSNASKVSTSFITSVTSITSLDTGYQGDGEMSRPASRSGNCCDHSPSNGPSRNHHQHHHKLNQIARQPSFNQQQQNIPIRRQDPMTDSDFFTESDADIDIMNRGDRRAQIIDGQLYGPSILQQPAASVFISEQPEMEDSCMESSGIFTDVENRCDDDLAINRAAQSQDIDMSPDSNTDTVKSNTTNKQQINKNDLTTIGIDDHSVTTSILSQGQSNNQLSDSQTSSTINSSFSSISTADYNQPSIQFKKINQQQQNTTATIESLPLLSSTSDIDSGVGDNFTTTNIKQQQQQHHEQQKKALINTSSINNTTNNINNVSSSAHSVKKFSPSRKHIANTVSSSVNQAGLKYDNKKSNNKILSTKKNVVTSLEDNQRVNKNIILKNSNDMINNKRLSTKTINQQQQQQDNKSPSASGSNNSSSLSFSSTSGAGVGGVVGTTVIVGSLNNLTPTTTTTSVPLRKFTPNKWDAVMNKIAENKTLKLKKNYQQIKSKVSTGVLLINGVGGNNNIRKLSSTTSVGNIGGKNHINENSENLIKCEQNKSEILCDNIGGSGTQSPIYNNNKFSNSGTNINGLTSPQQKRLIQGAIKRGRSYSKDSQQSSQSDLSLSGGSPKLLAKIPLRSAKKRDVRNLSISPTDLGPPPKTQTTTLTPNGITRTKNPTTILSQKRASQNLQSNNTPTSHGINKGSSPPPKKSTVRRQSDLKSHTKITLNDHNRLIGGQQQNGNIKTNGIITTNGGIGNLKVGNTSTPLSSISGAGKLRNGTTIQNNHSLASSTEKKQQTLHHQQHQKNKHEIVKQNGSLEVRIPPPLQPPDKSVEALGVLIQYLTYDLDAFNCPIIKNEFAQTQKHLLSTKVQLEDAKTTCHELQDQLQDKEHYYLTREQELQALHRCELNKVETTLFDLQTNAKERIASLESEILNKNAENQNKFQSYVQETELKFNQHDKELQLLKERELDCQHRINELTINENKLRDKIQDAENKYADKLQAAGQREKDLIEKNNLLNKQLDLMRKEFDNKERNLEAKLNIIQDEVIVLRHSRNSLAAANNSNNITKNDIGANKDQMLQNEVESLRCVLEIKQNDIAELRKKTQEINRENEELRAMQLKFSGIESRMEDIQIQLKTKDEENKELLAQIKQLKDSCTQESKNRTRLSLHNEELQWKLKQNSEKYAATITELSKSYQDKSGYLMSTSKTSFHHSQSQDHTDISNNSSSLSNSQNRSINGSGGCHFDMDDISPPASPIVKGVVEKSDSVSWVLEMDDETRPEILASRMVRRAGSFRSSFNEKYCNNSNSCNNKRQLSLPMGGAITPTINPLQQSASANMIIPSSSVRQHSSDATICDNSSLSIPKTRNRSNSVRGTETTTKKQLIRQNSVNSASGGISLRKHELQTTWKEPICSSSPYNRRIISRNSPPPSLPSTLQQQQSASCSTTKPMSKSFTATATDGTESTNIFTSRISKQSRHLITCDTSALTAGERFEMQKRSSVMPTSHSSVQDLNVLKKFQEIQESAGEAMVSGTNSEDESCSGSSDESPSTTSSNSSLGCGSEGGIVGRQHNSLGGTPMEVSWSSDAEQSIV